MVKWLFVTVFLSVGLLIIPGSIWAGIGPICLDSKGHLIWPNPQGANIVPVRSAATADTLANSPISVNGSNVGVSGNVAATGNVTGANICVGASCINSWSQVSGAWTQSGLNLFPNNLNSNVGIGKNDPTYKLDVNGTFRVTVNGEERLVIKETGAGPGAQSPNQHNLAQVKSAFAQTATDRWMELFGGSAFFLKRGTNSDVFLRVGDATTQTGSVGAKGSKPSFVLHDQQSKVLGQVRFDPQGQSVTLQYLKGWTQENPNVPISTIELTENGFKFWKGATPGTQKLIFEIGEE